MAKVLMESLESSQEETDTRIILHCLFASKSMTVSDKTVVRSPDTDVSILLLAYSIDIPTQSVFEIGNGNNKRFISISNISSILGEEVCRTLPAFHWL